MAVPSMKAILLLLLCVLGSILHTHSATWADVTSDALAQQTLQATLTFFNRSSSSATCNAYIQTEATILEGLQRAAALRILQQQACNALSEQQKMRFRIQLDMCAIVAPTAQYDVELYNAQAQGHAIELVPTPPWRTQADIAYTNVSVLAADARFTDLSGTGSDAISQSDPSHGLGMPWLLFYRRDIFAAAQIAPPETMDDVLSAAHQLNGTDFNGDGVPDHSVCFNPDPGCVDSYFTFLGILGPMLQTTPSQGVFFQPDTMEPLVRNAAMDQALLVYANLFSYNNFDTGHGTCGTSTRQFAAGKCAITFSTYQYRYSNAPWPNVTGNIGTAMFPGASQVLSRASNALEPCTKQLCPMAVMSSRTQKLVNFAPLWTVYRFQYIPAGTTNVAAWGAAYSFYQFISADFTSTWATQLSKVFGLQQPAATSTSAAAAPPADNASAPNTLASSSSNSSSQTPAASSYYLYGLNPQPMVDVGYNFDDTVSFLSALMGVGMHPNQLLDLAIPGAAYFRSAIAEAAANASLPGADLATITGALDTYYRMVARAFPNATQYQRLYWTMINYVPSGLYASTGARPPSYASAVAWRPGYTAAVAVPAAALLAALLLLWAYTHSRSSGRTLLGAVAPPGVGRSTTLLVTDIQNSTVMWEKLPMALMEEVLRVHHTTLRGLLDKHNGYESATEGDSFILAFHSPSDALAYAAEAQQCLLGATWPQDLLTNFEEARPIDAALCSDGHADLSYTVKKLQAESVAAGKRHAPGNGTALDFMHTVTPRIGSSPVPRIKSAQPWWRRLSFKPVPVDTPGSATLPEELEPEDFGSDATFSSVSSQVTNSSLGWSLSQAWSQLGNEPTHQMGFCVWRGLRVRMGIHSGLSNPMHAIFNKVSNCTQYCGDFASTAKAVGDAGHGGQIILSGDAFSQLTAKDRSRGLCVLLMGEHVLKEGQPSQPLYQAVVPGLEPRLESLPPLRTKELVQDGVQQAPVGTVTVVFMNATGVSTLLSWNAEVAQQSVQLYHKVVSALLPKYLGYVVEMADGLCLAAFQRPEQAIAWALAAQAELIDASWPEALLQHELCEVITTTVAVASKQDNGQKVVDTVSQVCSRGLRLKVGIDMGRVLDSVHPATGRMAYRGRVMNRAARISATATSGQVLSSPVAWHVASASTTVQAEGIIATSAGQHTLKGITRNMELYSCTIIACSADDTVSSRRSARRMSFILRSEQADCDPDHQAGGRFLSAYGYTDPTAEVEEPSSGSTPAWTPSSNNPLHSGGLQKEPLRPEGACLD